ncbi:hypothetical protein FKW77_006714 [Venturia effusa]|uniref:Uncharacterized protein n=1 Tax=Venturia effusa TaxID=50376 RepID=A0A517LHF8_9PEZI|nr:hypothetical protein FKW77_006714 [Venturia effusa]
MRLINVKTLELEEFTDTNTPDYAILSHRWGPAGSEIAFQDLRTLSPAQKTSDGYAKIINCCAQAARDGIDWAWVDTCCINKSSSAELSESINSMFRWYRDSKKCYAYLADVSLSNDPSSSSMDGADVLGSSQWFTRGWTLQELLAPSDLQFHSQAWTFIGTKKTLSGTISRITKIPTRILVGGSLSSVSIAARMSWAADRETTRIEDIAYSLLGIFDVHMPLLYGEGHKAFTRLQEQIMKESDDHSLFAWKNFGVPASTNWTSEVPKSDLFADSPAAFADAASIIPVLNMKASEPYAVTNKGIKLSVILIPYRGQAASEPLVTAVLECRLNGPFESLLGITLVRSFVQRE